MAVAESPRSNTRFMNLHLLIWRQSSPQKPGRMVPYDVKDISPDMSFLEMLDVLNEDLNHRGDEPIAFDSDCREGICGSCGIVVNGRPHGPDHGSTVCQLHMRHFHDGQTITIEPWRARAFPVTKDLCVDRTSFDRIVAAGGYISAGVGGAPNGNAIPVPKESSDLAMDAAQCISCGACVAACKNASAALFVGAKVSHLALLPQGQVEAKTRVLSMVEQADFEGFGSCSNEGECEAVCPKMISMANIARLNREYLKAQFAGSPR